MARRTPGATSALLQKANSQLKGERIERPEDELNAYISSLTQKTTQQKKSVNFEDLGDSISISSDIEDPTSSQKLKPTPASASKFLKKKTPDREKEPSQNVSKFIKTPQASSISPAPAASIQSRYAGRESQASSLGKSQASSALNKASALTGKIQQRAAVRRTFSVESDSDESLAAMKFARSSGEQVSESLTSESGKIGRDGGKFLKKPAPATTLTPVKSLEPPLTTSTKQKPGTQKTKQTEPQNKKGQQFALKSSLKYSTNVVLTSDEESMAEYMANLPSSSGDSFEKHRPQLKTTGRRTPSPPPPRKSSSPPPASGRHTPLGHRPPSPGSRPPAARRTPSPSPRTSGRNNSPGMRRRSPSPKLSRSYSDDSNIADSIKSEIVDDMDYSVGANILPSPRGRKKVVIMDLDELGVVDEPEPSPAVVRATARKAEKEVKKPRKSALKSTSEASFSERDRSRSKDSSPFKPSGKTKKESSSRKSDKKMKDSSPFRSKGNDRDRSPFKSSGNRDSSPFKSSGNRENRDSSPFKSSGNRENRESSPFKSSGNRDSSPFKSSGNRDSSPFKSSGNRDSSPFKASADRESPFKAKSAGSPFKAGDKTGSSPFRASSSFEESSPFKASDTGSPFKAERKGKSSSPFKAESSKDKKAKRKEKRAGKKKSKKSNTSDLFSSFGIQSVDDLFGHSVKESEYESVMDDVDEVNSDISEEIRTERVSALVSRGGRFDESATEVIVTEMVASYTEDFDSISEKIGTSSQSPRGRSSVSEVRTRSGEDTGAEYTEEFDESDTESLATESRTEQYSDYDRTYTDETYSSYSDTYTRKSEDYSKSLVLSTSRSDKTPVPKSGMRSAQVQTSLDPGLQYQWDPLASGMPFSSVPYGMSFVDPTPIASHVVSADALEAMTAYSPAMLALHDMLKSQLELTREFLHSQQSLYQNCVSNITGNYQYTTLEDTKQYIKKHRKKRLTFKEALKLVDAESR